MIPYGKQSIDQSDIDAVISVLKSDYLTTGPKVIEFEKALANYCDFTFAVSYNSATSALHCACLALGVNGYSNVWVPAMSFVATANCAEFCGANVSFVDIDLATGHLDLDLLESKLLFHQETQKPLPDVVIVVHYAGHLCDMPRVHKLAVTYGFTVIEDASHALGAKEPDHWLKEDRGDVVVYSFHPVKMITSAEGGVALSNSAEIGHRLRLFGNHGIEKRSEYFLKPEYNTGPWYYEQQVLGYNYRLNDMQAALGLSQLKRLDNFLERRREIAEKYSQRLGVYDLTFLNQSINGQSSYHLYPVLPNIDVADDLFKHLHQHEIFVQKHYIPIPQQPYYQNKYLIEEVDYPSAKAFYQRVIALPMYADLTDSQIDHICSTLGAFFGD